MNKLHVTLAVAASSLLTAMVAVGAVLTVHAPQAAVQSPKVDGIARPSRSSDVWSAPHAPLDETVITPVESAGAPSVL